ncbi:MAG: hypothetical protein ABL989_10505 [Gammaproteobacteria bacterium]
MKPETGQQITRPARRLFLASLAALHFLAAPCVMAMTAPADEEPCEHCGGVPEFAACSTTAAEPANDDVAPTPGRYREPDPPRLVVLPVSALVAREGSLHRAIMRAGPSPANSFRTGRHLGDPPLTITLGRLLI